MYGGTVRPAAHTHDLDLRQAQVVAKRCERMPQTMLRDIWKSLLLCNSAYVPVDGAVGLRYDVAVF